ncbi:MAG: hypothetical protein JSS43_06780, partial [Proteobacteria bacterium]|nr:hypothetical protein [Pseudomonadota bacterium]
DQKFERASAFALAGAVLTFFGFIHGPEGIGFASSPAVAISYLAVAGILFFLARFAAFHPVHVHDSGAAHGVAQAD